MSNELTNFCIANNIGQYYSGGGHYHHSYTDKSERILWAITDFKHFEATDEAQPVINLNDLVYASLHIDNIEWQNSDEFSEKLLEKMKELKNEAVQFDVDGLMISNLSLKDAFPHIRKTTDALSVFIDELIKGETNES